MRRRLGNSDEARGEVGALDSLEAGLAEETHRLRPAEDLLDAFPDALTDRVPRMPRRAAIKRGAMSIDHGNVRRDVALSACLDEIERVIAGSPASVIGCEPGRCSSSICSAASRSAVPLARVTSRSTISPLRFSIRACCANESFASLPSPLRARRALGSVVVSCVSLQRRSPKSTVGLPGSSGGGPFLLSLGLKLFTHAQASTSVPSTVKCSLLMSP